MVDSQTTNGADVDGAGGSAREGTAGTRYRADIQGLRAAAVLLVVASHLHVRGLAGGYVGVDVFFVISGYLISARIVPQIAAGTFSLREFYERRLRRIFPALIVMLAVTIPFAWHFLFPGEMVGYARSLLAAVFACSNLLHWSWGGYFDRTNELKPLLHTWSLGVEEQFYLLFPLCLMGVVRSAGPRRIRAAIFVLAGVSFAAACLLVYRYPHAAFFNIGMRAWELMLGAILSQKYVPGIRRRVARNVASGVGLVCVLLAAGLYSDSTIFPGLTAVVPCVGAALVIAAGESGGSLVGWLLSLRVCVFFGTISYSLYLWHWPVQVFAGLRHLQTCAAGSCDAPMGVAEKGAIFAISVALATASWRWVETPFLRDKGRFAWRRLWVASGFAAGVVAASAVMLIATQGAAFRYTPETVMAASQMDFDTYVPWRWGSCALGLDHTTAAMYDQGRCLPFTPGQRHYLLLGDSHAAHLWPGLSTVFPELEIGQANVAGCNLMPDKMIDRGGICRGMAKFVYDDLLRSGRVDTLIVSALWQEKDLDGIGQLASLARERGIAVILIGPTVAYDEPLPRLLGNISAAGGGGTAARSHEDAGLVRLDAQMAALARDTWKVRYISFFGDVCSAGACPVYAAPGVPLLLDSNHFSATGAVRFAEAMRDRQQIP